LSAPRATGLSAVEATPPCRTRARGSREKLAWLTDRVCPGPGAGGPDVAERGIHFGSGKPVKASIWNEDKSPPTKVVDCLFNPTDYTFTKRNEWAAGSITGGDIPLVNFASGGAMTLDVQLFFDTLTLVTTEQAPPDVREHTEKVLNLMKIDSQTADDAKSTPGR